MSLNQDNDSYRDMRSLLEGINGELGKKTDNLKEARKSYSSLSSTLTKLALQEEDITRYSDKQLKSYNEKAAAAIKEIKYRADGLSIEKQIASTGKSIYELNGAAFETTLKSLVAQGKLSEEESALVKAKKDGFALEEGIVGKINEEVAIRQKSNDLMGVGGGLLKGLNALAGGFASAFKLDQVQADMEGVADEIARGEKSAGVLGGRMKVLGAGLKSAGKGLMSTLTDPTVVLTAIFKGFSKVEEQQQNFRRITGQNADAYRGLNDSLTTTAEYLGGMVTLTKELGINANVAFSSETVTTVAELTENMGMAAGEAASLAKFSKLSGTSLKNNLSNVEDSFKSFVQTNGVALNFGDILSDTANTSDSIAMSLGNLPGPMTEAAMNAQKLGLSLQQVDDIASSLLNFQTSIEAEMEAELLTGTQINLEKAREAALNNDILGLQEEIGNNQQINQAFTSGNRIEQEALAKALGMSRNDMASMIALQKMSSGLSAEQAAKAANISIEEATRLKTQDQITKSIDKMAQALAPAIGFMTSLLSNTAVLYGVVITLTAAYVTLGVIKAINTVRTLAQTGAIAAQTAAQVALTASNVALAASNTTVGATATVAGGGMATAGVGVGAFGLGAAPAIPVILAIGAALLMTSPLIYAFSLVLEQIPPIISAVANGFVTMAGGFVTIVGSLTSLVGIAPTLLAVSLGLYSIAGGLAAMGVTGLLALPTLMALTALGAVSSPLVSIFGGEGSEGGEGGGSDGSGMSRVNANLEKLISIVEAGGDVYLDGNKIGKTMQLSTSRMG
tara:strand:+ start:1105 stop:3480 length:2376 start_codon:yes stop_codon:yes gene_type:complete